MNITKSTLALACGLAVSVGANAAYIDVVDANNPSSFNVDDTRNDYLGTVGALLSHGDEVQTGRKITSTSESKYQLTFTYLFKEASFRNSFWYKGSEVFNTVDNSFGDSKSFIYNDGIGDLDFAFDSGVKGSTTNANNDSTNGYDFFTYEGDGFILLGLDDSGAKLDDNHDDMIIKVTVSQVPEPGTLALLGLGLAGLGVGYRRRS